MTIQKMTAKAVFATGLAQTATYENAIDPPKSVRSIIKRDVEMWGDAMQVVARHTEISLLKSQVSLPKENDTITESDGAVWVITGRISDDGAVVKCSSRKQ